MEKKRESDIQTIRELQRTDCRTSAEGKINWKGISGKTSWTRYLRWTFNTGYILIWMGRILCTESSISSHIEEKH